MALWHRGTWEGCSHEIRAIRAVGSQTANWCTCMVHSQSAEAQEAGCSADMCACVDPYAHTSSLTGPYTRMGPLGTQLLFGSL